MPDIHLSPELEALIGNPTEQHLDPQDRVVPDIARAFAIGRRAQRIPGLADSCIEIAA
jgi:hypothetical protein